MLNKFESSKVAKAAFFIANKNVKQTFVF